jgi:hypothetical protein
MQEVMVTTITGLIVFNLFPKALESNLWKQFNFILSFLIELDKT